MIHPEISSQDVDSFLSTMGWSGTADSAYVIDISLKGKLQGSLIYKAQQTSRSNTTRPSPIIRFIEDDIHSIPKHKRHPKISLLRDSAPFHREPTGKGEIAGVYFT